MLGPVERAASTALLRVDPERGQDWKAYARSVLVFSARLLASLLYLILRTQTLHPFNPQDFNSGTVGRHVQHRRRRS